MWRIAPSKLDTQSMLSAPAAEKSALDYNEVSDSYAYNYVYVIDHNIQVRRSIHYMLSAVGVISWPFSCATDFLEELTHLQPAPILVGIGLPQIDGVDLMKILSDRGIYWPLLAMAENADIPTAVRAIKSGASEVLEMPFDSEIMNASLQRAFDQLSSLHKIHEIQCSSHRLLDSLTTRESEVMAALMDGLSNKAAAFRLSLSVRTIEMHRANAFRKLRVKSIAEVVRLAQDAGMHLTSQA